jgi:hypothetical protein
MRCAILLLSMIVLATAVQAAYFPIAFGYKWEYKTHSASGSNITVKTITSVDNSGTEPVYSMQISSKFSTQIEKIKVKEGWVYSDMGAGGDFFPILPPEPYVGETWQFSYNNSNKQYEYSYDVEENEKITIALGTFDALKLKITIQTEGSSEDFFAYYVDGIGLVQYTAPDYRQELIAYNFAK